MAVAHLWLKRTASLCASALHRLVLPVPGGPCSSTTLHARRKCTLYNTDKPVNRLLCYLALCYSRGIRGIYSLTAKIGIWRRLAYIIEKEASMLP
jgi:hypothetical protein